MPMEDKHKPQLLQVTVLGTRHKGCDKLGTLVWPRKPRVCVQRCSGQQQPEFCPCYVCLCSLCSQMRYRHLMEVLLLALRLCSSKVEWCWGQAFLRGAQWQEQRPSFIQRNNE